jgi:beta-glucosidase
VIDRRRADYLDRHVAAARRSGVPVEGHFVWSLLDNLEWLGYQQRLGFVHVDHASRTRTPEASYHWYRDVIRCRG